MKVVIKQLGNSATFGMDNFGMDNYGKMSFSGQLWKFFRTSLEWFFGQLWKKMDKFGNGKFDSNSTHNMTNFDKEDCKWVTIISLSQR